MLLSFLFNSILGIVVFIVGSYLCNENNDHEDITEWMGMTAGIVLIWVGIIFFLRAFTFLNVQ